jgi:hypothetical protein
VRPAALAVAVLTGLVLAGCTQTVPGSGGAAPPSVPAEPAVPTFTTPALPPATPITPTPAPATPTPDPPDDPAPVPEQPPGDPAPVPEQPPGDPAPAPEQPRDDQPGGPGPEIPTEPAPGPSGDDRPGRGAFVVDPLPDECVLGAAEIAALTGVAVLRPVQVEVPRDDGRATRGCLAVAEETGERVALVNVYGMRTGSPADAVAPGRPVDGVGTKAAVVTALAGPTLQVAGDRFLVTVQVVGRMPDDDAWRAAAGAALDRVE